MSVRLLRLTVLAAVLAAVLAVSAVMPAPSVYAQDGARDPLTDLLAYAPDTAETRQWLVYGDIAAWHTSWGVPRPLNLETFEMLPAVPRAYWMNIMPRQTVPPPALGLESLLVEDQQAFYGFDFFNVDRVLDVGVPPDGFAVVEHNAEPDDIAAQLVDSGYSTEALANGWTLYSILDDYETALGTDNDVPRVGQLALRNRIALNDQQMILARATEPVMQALHAANGDAPALLDDPAYAALTAALRDPLLDGTGALVGAIMLDGQQFSDDLRAVLGDPSRTQERIDALRSTYDLDDPDNLLPLFNAVAFATSHNATENASFLTLALAFPAGTDTDRVLGLLEPKLATYESIVTGESLIDHWTLARSGAITMDDVPVTLVVMQVDDPPPPRSDAARVDTSILSWYELLVQRDMLFLATGAVADAN